MGLAIALGAYLAYCLGHSSSGICMMAVPRPSYYATAYLGAVAFAAFAAMALWKVVESVWHDGRAGRRVAGLWLLIGAEAFCVTAYIASTIALGAMCPVWPFV